MKRKLKIMNHQIDQLKEEVSSKESALVKEHLEHQRVEKEKDALKEELQKMKAQAADTKAHIEAQEMEERKLVKIISEADAERLRQKKELDAVSLPWKYISCICVAFLKVYAVDGSCALRTCSSSSLYVLLSTATYTLTLQGKYVCSGISTCLIIYTRIKCCSLV